ncbi:lipopolysaccharide biosynthesis protein [Chitinophaga alhagiae]|uniref:lipopolysaccharide biosynthesis protein n=1 Tax=Chitinophaga alhagiae TaxID=2203219 RepID=UPI000E5AAA16|nr:polysaccharide biosynthesis C-terminal domain-containing protein [Chitinophaga alhagiae]
MGIIRKQSLRSSVVTYIGFAIGALNAVLFNKFVPAEVYGLTRIFFSSSLIFYAFASFGTATLLNKFYPYYRDYLPLKQRDLFGIVLIVSMVGFLLVTAGTIIFEGLIHRKYQLAPLFLQYFYLLYPFAFFYMLFTLFENFSYNHYRSVFPIFLKEVTLRAVTTILIVLMVAGLFSSVQFIYAFSCLYAVIFIALIIYLRKERTLQFSFKTSSVTRRLAYRMTTFNLWIFGGSVFVAVQQNLDSILITSTNGLVGTAVLEFNTYVSNVIQVPQRSMIAIAVPILAKAWKDKDMEQIQRIYTRSSMTMLIFSILIFMLIWLNLESVYHILDLNPVYWTGRYIILFYGLGRIVELGAGVNGQIIGTSDMWRFDFVSNLVLIALSIPLNYYFIKTLGINGPGIAQLIAISVFTIIRFTFLLRRYKMQPFSLKTLYVVLLGIAGWLVCAWLVTPENHYLRVILRSAIFAGIFLLPILVFGWSQDVTESWHKGLALVRKYWQKK